MKTAIILAAGQGRRLLPLTINMPKNLLVVGGLPIFHRQLFALEENGVTDIVIVVGFMKDKIRKYAISNFPSLSLTFVENRYHDSTNTLYSLALATGVAAPDRTVIQLNGDVVFDPEILEKLLKTENNKSYAAVNYKPCGEEEIKVITAEDGSILALNKQIPSDQALGEAVGINKFSPHFWGVLRKNLQHLKNILPNEYFEYALEKVIAEGEKIFPLNVNEYMAIEIDFQEDLEKVNKEFSKNPAWTSERHSG